MPRRNYKPGQRARQWEPGEGTDQHLEHLALEVSRRQQRGGVGRPNPYSLRATGTLEVPLTHTELSDRRAS